MRAARLATCLWPGLARLWLRAEFRGLGEAILFGGMVNALLFASFSQPPWIGSVTSSLGWSFVAAVWCVGVWRGCRVITAYEGPDEDLFLRAQAEYLRGHWFEAESLLGELLKGYPGDGEARLMLAALYRHTGRWNEARRELTSLQRSDSGLRWQLEVQHELALLERGQREQADGAPPAADENAEDSLDDEPRPARRAA